MGSGHKPRPNKTVEQLDAKRMGDLIAVRNGLQYNIPGAMVNGTRLLTPAACYASNR